MWSERQSKKMGGTEIDSVRRSTQRQEEQSETAVSMLEKDIWNNTVIYLPKIVLYIIHKHIYICNIYYILELFYLTLSRIPNGREVKPVTSFPFNIFLIYFSVPRPSKMHQYYLKRITLNFVLYHGQERSQCISVMPSGGLFSHLLITTGVFLMTL